MRRAEFGEGSNGDSAVTGAQLRPYGPQKDTSLSWL